eukprot:1150977-Pelagomonas_calceolata.AAC.6
MTVETQCMDVLLISFSKPLTNAQDQSYNGYDTYEPYDYGAGYTEEYGGQGTGECWMIMSVLYTAQLDIGL